MNWNELIGKSPVAFRGYKTTEAWKTWEPQVPLSFVLFDDKETIMEFSEQSPYDYHDCNGSARTIELYKNAAKWKQLFDKEVVEEATDLACPF